MAYTVIDNPGEYFNTKLYTGTGSSLANTGVGFQPDWVWIKGRSGATEHVLTDSVRGVTKELSSNDAGAEETVAQGLTAFGSDGFTVGTDGSYNTGSATYASWNWKAGTSFTNDASATGVGSIDSAGSVNTDAGFSIVSWTGTGANATVAHGLGSVPKMIILKNRDSAENWIVGNTSLGWTKYLALNLSDSISTASNIWQDTTPTSSVFSIGASGKVNGSTHKMIVYCFADVKGYSKFGSYIGNGNADGTFVYTGFKPAFVFMKNTADSGGSWQLFDNKRNTYNQMNGRLFPNANSAENTDADNNIDFLSNGFKWRGAVNFGNNSGGTYIYMAWAEHPFANPDGAPATAR